MDEFNSPMNQTPPVDPMQGGGGLGMLMADPMAEKQQQADRLSAFMRAVQQIQESGLTLAKTEPNFSEASQIIWQAAQDGAAKVAQAMAQSAEGMAPPY